MSSLCLDPRWANNTVSLLDPHKSPDQLPALPLLPEKLPCPNKDGLSDSKPEGEASWPGSDPAHVTSPLYLFLVSFPGLLCYSLLRDIYME